MWVIKPEKTSYFALTKADELVPLVKSYRAQMHSLHDAQDGDGDSGKKLYAMLVGPAVHLLRKESRLTVLPDPADCSRDERTSLD